MRLCHNPCFNRIIFAIVDDGDDTPTAIESQSLF